VIFHNRASLGFMDETNIPSIICEAIQARLLISSRSTSGEFRIIEPHAFEVGVDGRDILWAWTRAGERSDPNVQAGWGLYPISEMHDVQLLTETFPGPRPNYRRGNKWLRRIYAQL
jgi:hypothetical protein